MSTRYVLKHQGVQYTVKVSETQIEYIANSGIGSVSDINKIIEVTNEQTIKMGDYYFFGGKVYIKKGDVLMTVESNDYENFYVFPSAQKRENIVSQVILYDGGIYVYKCQMQGKFIAPKLTKVAAFPDAVKHITGEKTEEAHGCKLCHNKYLVYTDDDNKLTYTDDKDKFGEIQIKFRADKGVIRIQTSRASKPATTPHPKIPPVFSTHPIRAHIPDIDRLDVSIPLHVFRDYIEDMVAVHNKYKNIIDRISPRN